MSTILNQYQQNNFNSNINQNLKNNNHCLDITTQSCKATVDLPMPVVNHLRKVLVQIGVSIE